MIYSRNVGRAKIYNVLEYSGPTHAADFVFPELDVKEIKPHLSWLAQHPSRAVYCRNAVVGDAYR